MRVHLVVAHREPAPAPWFLITNLALHPHLVESLCAKRFWIEEGIRACKSGLSLKRLWLSDPERTDRMMIVAAVAMLLTLLTGVASRLRGDRPQVTTSKKKALPGSISTIGARLLTMYPNLLCTDTEVLCGL